MCLANHFITPAKTSVNPRFLILFKEVCYCEHKDGTKDGKGNGIMCGKDGKFVVKRHCAVTEKCSGASTAATAVSVDAIGKLCSGKIQEILCYN